MIEYKKISELLSFVPGINPTRAEKQFGEMDIVYYDQASFEEDYYHKNGYDESSSVEKFENIMTLSEGDIVMSNSMQLATIVGVGNSGKVPSLNFTKININSKKLDKKYFIYLFNVYSGIKKQKERELQGSGTARRIPIKALGEIIIPIVSLEEQKRIGKAHFEMQKLQSKVLKYNQLVEQFVGSVLEENIKEKKNER